MHKVLYILRCFFFMRNIEIKAKVKDLEPIRKRLKSLNPRYIGLDHQIDTYYKVKQGRLKLREGNIETNLIITSGKILFCQKNLK